MNKKIVIKVSILSAVLAALFLIITFQLPSETTHNKKSIKAEYDLNRFLETSKYPSYPKDPWGRDYIYQDIISGNYTCTVLMTFGADKRPGGENENQDRYRVGKCASIDNSQESIFKSH